MLQLLKAEIEYHYYSIIILLVTILPVSFLIVFIGWDNRTRDIPGASFVAFVATVIVFFIWMIRSSNERTVRMHILLPVSPLRVAVTRLLFPIFLWSFSLSLFLLALGVGRTNDLIAETFWHSISLTGFAAMTFAFALFCRDISYLFVGRLQAVVITPLLSLMIIGFLMGMIFLFGGLQSMDPDGFSFRILGVLVPYTKPVLVDLVWTPEGALVLMSGGILMTLTSLLTFLKRKQYLE